MAEPDAPTAGGGPRRAAGLWRRLGRLAYGGDYNPEQWDEATWSQDVKLMSEAGVNLVTLGVFAWAALEPERGRFDFSWLDRVMQLLGDGGISVCLATGTASPPPWLVRECPGILPVDAWGRQLWHGSRQHFCPSSREYRAAAGALAERLAARYKDHPALAAWHPGNEYGCHVARCYCDRSAEDFRDWLRRRYGDLEALNAAWSTSFWSQRYSDWAEIIPPRLTPTFGNPAQQLDFFRFSNHAMLECFRGEAAILGRLAPEIPVTTNFLGIWNPVDAFAWAGAEDFVSHDSYPDPADPDAAAGAAMAFDLMRGAGGGNPWLLMEQAPSAVNWRARNRPKPPGMYRLWSWQAVAHGANGVLSFQWRASRGGAEKFHSAMVPHAGAEHPLFRTVRQLGRELSSVPDLAATRPARSQVALVFDWSSWWALELPSRPSSQLSQLSLLRSYYEPLWRRAIPADIVHPGSDLSGYRIVLVPNLYLMEEAWAENLTAFAENGGVLLAGFFSGIVDGCDVVPPGPYPGFLRELLGMEVDQFWPLGDGERVPLRLHSGASGYGTLWSEEIRLTGAEARGWFAGPDLGGGPALTRIRRGRGEAWYAGTLPDPALLGGLLDELTACAGVARLLPVAREGVEAQRRAGRDGEVLFLLNHRDQPATAEVPPGYAALVGPAPGSGRVELGPRGVAVLRRPLPGGRGARDT